LIDSFGGVIIVISIFGYSTVKSISKIGFRYFEKILFILFWGFQWVILDLAFRSWWSFHIIYSCDYWNFGEFTLLTRVTILLVFFFAATIPFAKLLEKENSNPK
ncbi:MAG: hypothetical protein AAF570_22800, partial [Bacteroidota bacterium]